MAKAYWVTTYREVHDEDKLAAYRELSGPALQAGGGRFLARSTPARVMESGRMARTVVVEFDSVDAAVAAYESPAYQEALRALDGGADRDMRIVEGVE